MATATKAKTKKPAKAKPKAKKPTTKPRPLLDKEELKDEEKLIREDYPHVIKGTLRNIGEDPKRIKVWTTKRTVEIKCAKRGCAIKRRVATSDLHQVDKCPDCTIDERLKRRREARKLIAEKPK